MRVPICKRIQFRISGSASQYHNQQSLELKKEISIATESQQLALITFERELLDKD